MIVCGGTKEERMEQGRRKMRDEEVEKEGEWGSSAMMGEERRDGGRGGQDRWSEGRERKAGMERGEGRAGC